MGCAEMRSDDSFATSHEAAVSRDRVMSRDHAGHVTAL